MTCQNHWELKGLYRIYTGEISGDEIFTSNRTIQGDARFDEIKYVVNDFTRVNEFDVSKDDIHKIVVFDNVASKSNPVLKIAIVATLEPLLNLIALYCKMMQGSSYETRVFAKIDDAYQWVGEEKLI